MPGTNRRVFLAAAAASGLAAKPLRANDPPSERVRVAVIGARGRGSELTSFLVKDPSAEIACVCDVDNSVVSKPLGIIEAAAKPAPKVVNDFRRVLDDRGVDAVFVAAPDHWHALMTVMACQSGKDVYCEKPVCHNIVEGRRMVEAARKYNRVVQAGMQRRSSPEIKTAIDLVQSGGIGKVAFARTWIIHKRPSIGKGIPSDPPKSVDYALWQGPAPERPFYANRFHYNWHWFWNWGTGELGNNGIHAIDVARWGLGLDAPTTVASSGGKLYFDDDQETPDVQIASWSFPSALLVWEHRLWSDHPIDGEDFGVSFEGDKGTVVIGSKQWKLENSSEKAGGKINDPQAAHVANFLDCVKTRKSPNAEIEVGHLSARLCHLGNIAQRLERKVAFDAATESFGSDSDANALLSREYGKTFAMPTRV